LWAAVVLEIRNTGTASSSWDEEKGADCPYCEQGLLHIKGEKGNYYTFKCRRCASSLLLGVKSPPYFNGDYHNFSRGHDMGSGYERRYKSADIDYSMADINGRMIFEHASTKNYTPAQLYENMMLIDKRYPGLGWYEEAEIYRAEMIQAGRWESVVPTVGVVNKVVPLNLVAHDDQQHKRRDIYE
jgi:hypothetical protein